MAAPSIYRSWWRFRVDVSSDQLTMLMLGVDVSVVNNYGDRFRPLPGVVGFPLQMA